MAKTIALKIEIEGLSQGTKEIVTLENELKSAKEQAKALENEIKNITEELKDSGKSAEEIAALNKQLDEAESQYVGLRNTITLTNEELKQAKKEQRDFIKDAQSADFADGSYLQLNKQLVDLRKQYKTLSAAERESAKGKELEQKIKSLDTELKKIDAGIGQFQRNVGNYPRGVGRIVKSLEQLVPGFQNFSKQLTNAEGRLSTFGKALVGGFVAFQAAKFIGKAVEQLSEFIKKIDETREAVSQFSDASGDDLNKLTAQTSALADTFDTDAQSIGEAAQALANNLGIGFDEALSKLEETLVEGRGDADEYLQQISQYPETFEEASGAVTDFSERNQQLLNTNKELAESQVEVANKLAPVVDQLTQLGQSLKTQLLVGLVSVIDTFKPVAAAVVDFGKAIGNLVGSLFGAGDATKGFSNLLKSLSGIAEQAVRFTTFLINSVSSLVNLLRGDASQAYAMFSKQGAIAAETNARVTKSTEEVTKEFQRETEELNDLFGQLAKTNKNSKEREEIIKQLNNQYGEYLPNIDLEKAGQEDLADAYTETTKAIARSIIERKKLQIQEEAIAKVLDLQIKAQVARQKAEEASAALGESERDRARNVIFDIAQEATQIGNLAGSIAGRTNNTKELVLQLREAEKAEADANKEREIAEKQLKAISDGAEDLANKLSGLVKFDDLATQKNKVNAKERTKDREAETKEASDLYKKLQEERKKFQDEEVKNAQARAALLADLEAKILEQSIKNIEDERERRIAEINNSFNNQLDALKKGYEKLEKEQKEREEQLANSQDVLQSREAFATDALKIKQKQAELEKKLEESRQQELKKARSEFRKEDLDEAKKIAEDLRAFRDQALQDELGYIDQQAQIIQLKNQENLNKLLAQTEDATKRELIIRAQAEQDIIDQRAVLLNKLQALNDAEEELIRQASDEDVEIKQEEYDAILLARQQLNTQLSELEMEQTRIVQEESKKQSDARQKQFESIALYFQQGLELLDGFLDAANEREQARLDEQAAATEKRIGQLEGEIEQATGLRKKYLQQQLENEVKNSESIAQQQEAIAKKAAIQDKAIALTQAAIQGALAVTRAIASPPGPPLNTPTVIATTAFSAAQLALIASKKFADGGLIQGPSHADGGVPFTVQGRAGFEAEGGEFIVNKKATAKYLPILHQINKVKFADGGLIGGVPTSPNFGGAVSQGTESLKAFNERTEAIKQQVLRTQVVLVTDDLDEDRADQERIKKRVRLA